MTIDCLRVPAGDGLAGRSAGDRHGRQRLARRRRRPGARRAAAGAGHRAAGQHGFAGGCNLGIRRPGSFDFVALVNNDATVDPGWLRPLVAAFDARAASARRARRCCSTVATSRPSSRCPTRRPIGSTRGRSACGSSAPGSTASATTTGCRSTRGGSRPRPPIAGRRRGDRPLVVAARPGAGPGRRTTCPRELSLRVTAPEPRHVTVRTGSGRGRRRTVEPARDAWVDGRPRRRAVRRHQQRRVGAVPGWLRRRPWLPRARRRPVRRAGRGVRLVRRRGPAVARRTSTTSGCSTSGCSSTTRTPTCRGAVGCAGGGTSTSRRRCVRHRHAASSGGPARRSSATTPSATGC